MGIHWMAGHPSGKNFAFHMTLQFTKKFMRFDKEIKKLIIKINPRMSVYIPAYSPIKFI